MSPSKKTGSTKKAANYEYEFNDEDN